MMWKKDFLFAFVLTALFLPFFISDQLFGFYWEFNGEHPYLMAWIKFFILAPVGEMLGLRIKSGVYLEKGFGLIPRAVTWGFLGISLKMAFDIFSFGTPHMLINMGLDISPNILEEAFSMKKLLVTFSIGACLNLFYAPILMVTHKITDEHIKQYDGSFSALYRKIEFGHHLVNMNWQAQWDFTFKKAIPFFWIPAQTINFLFPDELRILVAALYSIILGVLLALVNRK